MLYLPSPPPERNSNLQAAPTELSTSSSAGRPIGTQTPGVEQTLGERLPGACARCKRLKVRTYRFRSHCGRPLNLDIATLPFR